MFGLENFDFRSLWSPWFMLFLTLIIVVYFVIVGRYRHLFKDSSPVGAGKKILFLTGIVLYYIAQGSPLYLMGHLIFSAHMISMSIAYLIAPPLIILGLPAWLLRSILYSRIKQVFNFMTHPILTLLLFNVLFSFYHFPMVFDFIMTHYIVHTIYFSVLLFASFLMWWTIVCPVPELDRLSELRKMGYIFANGVLLTPACGLIIFADTTLYGTYSDPVVWAKALGYCLPGNSTFLLDSFKGPGFFAIFSPIEDQQLGGVIMKLMQEFVYGIILFFVFLKWYRKENPRDVIDELPSDLLKTGPLIQ